mmetsp:Transcript_23305/g.49224  ORF Transcript_23305/g.49224 Transcript_23305/m.49224 type:complete len:312 (-) Transcript_23305:543-1478(-)
MKSLHTSTSLLFILALLATPIISIVTSFECPPPLPPHIVQHHRRSSQLCATSKDKGESSTQEEISIGQYSHGLKNNPNLWSTTAASKTNKQKSIHDESRQYSIIDSNNYSRWLSLLTSPITRTSKLFSKLFTSSSSSKSKNNTGSLILIRCGESTWTTSGTFTGWADPPLSPAGRLQIEHAGRLLLSYGIDPEVIYTSRLSRAIKSSGVISNVLGAPYLPLYKSWRLNERNYGALTGLKKGDAAREFGVEMVQDWRNSLHAIPPAMKKSDPHYPGNDRRYGDLTEDQIPLTESLMDCMERGEFLSFLLYGK